MMVIHELLSRVKTMSLEQCVKELTALELSSSDEHNHRARIVYEDLINDAGAYILLGVGKHYCGREDGFIDPLAVAKIRLLSYELIGEEEL